MRQTDIKETDLNATETQVKTRLTFNNLPETPVSEGLSLLKTHLFDKLTCNKEMRFLILSWLCTVLLEGPNPKTAILHFYSAPDSGKSTAAAMLSALLNGSNCIRPQSSAAYFQASSTGPLFIQYDLVFPESESGLVNFFLQGLTYGTKKMFSPKEGRSRTQKIRVHILTTGIDPFPEAFPELSCRTLQVRFEDRLHRPDFDPNLSIQALIDSRDIILSAMNKLVKTDILAFVSNQSSWRHYIELSHPRHPNSRTNDFIATLAATLQLLLVFIPYDPDQTLLQKHGSSKISSAVLLDHWIEHQERIGSPDGT